MSDKKVLLMLNQPPTECHLDRLMDIIDHTTGRGALFMGDSVYMLVTGEAGALLERGVKFYALRHSVEARGLEGRLMDGVELVDYHRAIDLIMEEHDMVV